MRIQKTKLKIQAVPARLTCSANNNLSSIINRFPNTHTPVFAYGDNKEFMGLLTAHNIFRNRRYNPLTLIRSCLISPPKLSIDTSVDEILRSMSSLKLYILPVFNDKGNVAGIIKVKTLLKDLIKRQIFAETMIENVPRRSVITIPENSSIGDAFQRFSKHTISRLVVVDKNNKIMGVVTKRDILSLYLSPTKHQRFSTRSHPKNYSFDTEQIKRDRQPLMKYVSPILDVLDETTDTYLAIQNLLESAYNSVILVDKERVPRFIITTKDVLKTAVRITKKVPYLQIIVSKLPNELSQAEKNMVNKDLRKIALWINKQQNLQLMRFTSKVTNSPERKPVLFEVKLKITTNLARYFAQNKDRDFLHATQEVIKQVKKQVRRLN